MKEKNHTTVKPTETIPTNNRRKPRLRCWNKFLLTKKSAKKTELISRIRKGMTLFSGVTIPDFSSIKIDISQTADEIPYINRFFKTMRKYFWFIANLTVADNQRARSFPILQGLSRETASFFPSGSSAWLGNSLLGIN